MTFELSVAEAERLEVTAGDIEKLQAQAIIQIGANLAEAEAIFKYRSSRGQLDVPLSTVNRVIAAISQKRGAAKMGKQEKRDPLPVARMPEDGRSRDTRKAARMERPEWGMSSRQDRLPPSRRAPTQRMASNSPMTIT